MKDLFILLGHLLVTIAKLLRPGGARAVAAENALLKKRLLALKRSRRRRSPQN
jgi:putative transposase